MSFPQYVLEKQSSPKCVCIFKFPVSFRARVCIFVLLRTFMYLVVLLPIYYMLPECVLCKDRKVACQKINVRFVSHLVVIMENLRVMLSTREIENYGTVIASMCG